MPSSLGPENRIWRSRCNSQRVHVGIWYILRAQRGYHIPTLRPKYIPYTYMDPLGFWAIPYFMYLRGTLYVGVRCCFAGYNGWLSRVGFLLVDFVFCRRGDLSCVSASFARDVLLADLMNKRTFLFICLVHL